MIRSSEGNRDHDRDLKKSKRRRDELELGILCKLEGGGEQIELIVIIPS